MSRIGKQPIQLPSGVKVNLKGSEIEVSGTKGSLKREIPPRVKVDVSDGQILVNALDGGREARALHGLTRTLINNMVVGVTAGYTRVLEISGVGYRADVRSDTLHLSLGYSHPIEFKLPQGIQASVDKQNRITLSGIEVPPQGMSVRLTVETQHGDPDQGSDESHRIILWQNERWIDSNEVAQPNATITFTPEFVGTTLTVNGPIPTPTDYFKYKLTITDANNAVLYTFEEEYAFLMENQWVAQLPQVSEEIRTTRSDQPSELELMAFLRVAHRGCHFLSPSWRCQRRSTELLSPLAIFWALELQRASQSRGRTPPRLP